MNVQLSKHQNSYFNNRTPNLPQTLNAQFALITVQIVQLSRKIEKKLICLSITEQNVQLSRHFPAALITKQTASRIQRFVRLLRQIEKNQFALITEQNICSLIKLASITGVRLSRYYCISVVYWSRQNTLDPKTLCSIPDRLHFCCCHHSILKLCKMDS